MPKLFSFRGFTIYFWTAENGEPVHVHVAQGKPTRNATKIWLTRSGGCLLASNGSNLSKHELSYVMNFVALNHKAICEYWSEYFDGDLTFYR